MSADFDPREFVTIPPGWTCKRLIDCTIDGNLSYGIVQPGQHAPNGVPVIRINNINNGQLDLHDVLKVDPEIESKYQRTRLEGGEVLLTLVGSTGQSFVAPVELKGWNVPRAIAVIRADKEIGADWINICLQSQETKHFLDVRANTTVQKTLNLKDVRDIPILLPPKEVKELIKDIATSLSKKIELNRRTNQTLEQIAQVMFKSWFVDFEPTRAKIFAKEAGVSFDEIERAAMCAISGKTPDQLVLLPLDTQQQLKTTAALFPDALVDSELGEIPEGWEVKSLSDLGNVVCGKTPPKDNPEYYEGDIPFIKIPDMHGKMYATKTTDTLTRAGANTQIKKLLPKDSICVSCIATVGLVLLTCTDSHTNQQINTIVPTKNNHSPYIYFSMLGLNDHLHDLASGGSATLNLNTGHFSKIKISFPCEEILDTFFCKVKPIFNLILKYSFEIDSLEQIRDSLLPKLLSGEIQLQNNEETENVQGRRAQ